MDAQVKQMPDYHLAYVRKTGPYGAETCQRAFEELMQWAGSTDHMASAAVLALYWDDPQITPADKCRTDACISVPPGTAVEDPVAIQTIGGGPYLVCPFEITSEGFAQAWQEAYDHFMSNQYEGDEKPCYELYHNDASDHPEGKWLVDICIPLKDQ